MSFARGTVDSVGLDALEGLTELSLEKIRLSDFAAIGRLRQLRTLGLMDCGPIEDIDFISSLTHLEHIALHGTHILSGDLSPLDDLPSVLTRYVQPRKHYNRRYTDSVAADQL